MQGQRTEDKVTIKTASQILGVSTKTIQRYLSKGLITKLKQGTRTLLILAEVKAIQSDPTMGQGRPTGLTGKTSKTGLAGDTVTLSMERYEQLLLELGELRKQNQFFMEFKGMLLAKEESLRRLEHDLEQLRQTVHTLELKRQRAEPASGQSSQEAETEVAPASRKGKKPWWQV